MTDTAERHRALVLAPMRGPGLAALEAIADIVHDPFTAHIPLHLHNAAQLLERLEAERATILVSEADGVSAEVLEHPLLRVVGSTRGDPTNVDIAAATARGIPVLRAPGRNADAVAEMTIALLFAATRGIVGADRDVRTGQIYKDGSIPYQRYRAWELQGRTAGIVGYGAIGRALAWRLQGLGMQVIASDPYAPDAEHSLDELLAEADVVSMHATVNDQTRGMMGAPQFARMKPGAVYLNAARAALHDVDALVASLRDGHLAAAGLDHFEGEFLAPDAPLAQLPNIVLTPHIGGATYNTEANHSRSVGEGIVAVLRGEIPDNCVNPEVLR